jgi:hypothetical protein
MLDSPAVPKTREISEVAWFRLDDIPRPVPNVLYNAVPDAIAGKRDIRRRDMRRVS